MENKQKYLFIILFFIFVLSVAFMALYFTSDSKPLSSIIRKSRTEEKILGIPTKLNLIFPSFTSVKDGIFGKHLFSHDTGDFYFVTHTETNPERLYILGGKSTGYSLLNNFEIPSGYQITGGAVAPSLNITNNQVLHFFLSIGVQVDPLSFSGYRPSNLIVAFSCDRTASSTNNQWNPVSFVAEDSTRTLLSFSGNNVFALSHPFSNQFVYPSGTNASSFPFLGSFGDNIQVIIDDTNPYGAVTHSIYLSGTEYDRNSPGGCVFWYSILRNSIQPNIQLNMMIKDSKLLLLKKYGATTNSYPNPYSQSLTDYAYSFGFSFHVTSGLGSDNLLFIGNPGTGDYGQPNNLNYSDSSFTQNHNGYVQTYVLSTGNYFKYVPSLTNPTINTPHFTRWTQLTKSIGVGGSQMLLRFSVPDGSIAPVHPGFGGSVHFRIHSNGSHQLFIGHAGGNPESSCFIYTLPDNADGNIENPVIMYVTNQAQSTLFSYPYKNVPFGISSFNRSIIDYDSNHFLVQDFSSANSIYLVNDSDFVKGQSAILPKYKNVDLSSFNLNYSNSLSNSNLIEWKLGTAQYITIFSNATGVNIAFNVPYMNAPTAPIGAFAVLS